MLIFIFFMSLLAVLFRTFQNNGQDMAAIIIIMNRSNDNQQQQQREKRALIQNIPQIRISRLQWRPRPYGRRTRQPATDQVHGWMNQPTCRVNTTWLLFFLRFFFHLFALDFCWMAKRRRTRAHAKCSSGKINIDTEYAKCAHISHPHANKRTQ